MKAALQIGVLVAVPLALCISLGALAFWLLRLIDNGPTMTFAAVIVGWLVVMFALRGVMKFLRALIAEMQRQEAEQ